MPSSRPLTLVALLSAAAALAGCTRDCATSSGSRASAGTGKSAAAPVMAVRADSVPGVAPAARPAPEYAVGDTANRQPLVPLDVQAVTWEGEWLAPDSTRGSYRFIERAGGFEEITHAVTMEWIADETPDDAANPFRGSVDLRPDGAVSVSEPHVVQRDGHWYVTVSYAKHLLEDLSEKATFELGPPKQIRQVATP